MRKRLITVLGKLLKSKARCVVPKRVVLGKGPQHCCVPPPPAACYWLRPVLDYSGRWDRTSPSYKGARRHAADLSHTVGGDLDRYLIYVWFLGPTQVCFQSGSLSVQPFCSMHNTCAQHTNHTTCNMCNNRRHYKHIWCSQYNLSQIDCDLSLITSTKAVYRFCGKM